MRESRLGRRWGSGEYEYGSGKVGYQFREVERLKQWSGGKAVAGEGDEKERRG